MGDTARYRLEWAVNPDGKTDGEWHTDVGLAFERLDALAASGYPCRVIVPSENNRVFAQTYDWPNPPRPSGVRALDAAIGVEMLDAARALAMKAASAFDRAGLSGVHRSTLFGVDDLDTAKSAAIAGIEKLRSRDDEGGAS